MIVSNAAAQGSRPYQEDYHAFYQPPPGLEARGSLFLLADGMGGMAAGSTASLMAVQYFRERYYAFGGESSPEASIPQRLGTLMAGANQELVRCGATEPSLRGMGTTLIACAVADNRLYFASIGDSHLYLCRRGEIRLLNEDHSVGGQLAAMLAQGKLSPDEYRLYEGQAHKLVHYLGNRHFSHFNLSGEPVLLSHGDKVIMCSDGLYGSLPDADIAGVAAATSPRTAADALVKAALHRDLPGQDNLTVQVLTYQDAQALAGRDTLSVLAAAPRLFFADRRVVLAAALTTIAVVTAAALLWIRSWAPAPAADGNNAPSPVQAAPGGATAGPPTSQAGQPEQAPSPPGRGEDGASDKKDSDGLLIKKNPFAGSEKTGATPGPTSPANGKARPPARHVAAPKPPAPAQGALPAANDPARARAPLPRPHEVH